VGRIFCCENFLKKFSKNIEPTAILICLIYRTADKPTKKRRYELWLVFILMQSSAAGVLITAHTEDISKARPKHINLLTVADKNKNNFQEENYYENSYR